MTDIAVDKTTDSVIRVEFGRKTVSAELCESLAVGEVIELDAFVDDYVSIYANGQLIARGRAVVVDGNLAVRVQESLTVPLTS